MVEAAPERATYRKVAWRLLPLLFVGYCLAMVDRVNVGVAKLQMASDLELSDAVYGFGAGIFFVGYFLCEFPSNLIQVRVGARRWLARIMVTWGMISAGFMFTGSIAWGGIARAFGTSDAEFTFYLLRFLLGVAEAGFVPGVLVKLVVLALIDVVMISNLLIMVIVGGYETFVSRLGLDSHPDQPEWLDHVNASVLKVKLALSIIGISSIHLLKTFINAGNYDVKVLMWQTIIHAVFLLSALAIAYTDKLIHSSHHHAH